MKIEVGEILKNELNKFFGSHSSSKIEIQKKSDRTLVTEIDFLVNKIIKEKIKLSEVYKNYTFYSEEEHGELEFPCVILDPIDGTNELILGRPECAISLAIMSNPDVTSSENYAWIYNPFTGFSLSTDDIFYSHYNYKDRPLLGLISRNEWSKKKDYFSKLKNMQIKIAPRGSIAFKLGLLASGGCDFVLSLAPKNIWDIAAGTILLQQRDIFFYCNGVIVTRLDQVRYRDTLLWCHKSLAAEILEEFTFENK